MARWLTVACSIALLPGCGEHPSAPEQVLFVNNAPDLNSELEFEGRAEQVAIAPDGRIWLPLAGTGEIVVADSVLAPWTHALYPPWRHDRGNWRRPSVSLVFFTPDTMLGLGLGDDRVAKKSTRRVGDGEAGDYVVTGFDPGRG